MNIVRAMLVVLLWPFSECSVIARIKVEHCLQMVAKAVLLFAGNRRVRVVLVL